RVHHRGGDPGDQVGGAGARRRHTDAYLARRPRETVRHVCRTLLVPHEHVTQRKLWQRVVRRHDRTTGVTEDDFDSLTDQHVPDDLRASERLRAGHGLEAFWSLGNRVGQRCGHGVSPRGVPWGKATLTSARAEVYR